MNIFCGNLAFNLKPDEAQKDLEELFGQYGQVLRVSVIADVMDPERSRGYGFVVMPIEDEAWKAISELNGSPFQGRALRLAPAEPPRWEKVG